MHKTTNNPNELEQLQQEICDMAKTEAEKEEAATNEAISRLEDKFLRRQEVKPYS